MRAAHIILFVSFAVLGPPASAGLIKDVEYGRPDGVSLKLDISVPEGEGPFPIAIMVHGGGFVEVGKHLFSPALFEPLTEAKFTWFNISHRGLLTNSYPSWVEDVEQSLRWVKAHAAQYKGDPGRIALIGESFGAYLVLLAAGRASPTTRPNAVVAFYPPWSDLTRGIENGRVSEQLKKIYGIEKNEDGPRILREASTVTYLRAGFPPLLIVHGTADTKAPYADSVKAQTRMTEAKGSCELISVEGAPHGMSEWGAFDQGYKGRMIAWLSRTLGPPAVPSFDAQSPKR